MKDMTEDEVRDLAGENDTFLQYRYFAAARQKGKGENK